MDITIIVGAVITIAVALITGLLIPYIKGKMTEQQFKNLEKWTKIAVKAVEQAYKEPSMGGAKKQDVIDFLQKKGLVIDMDEVDKMLEANVWDLNHPETASDVK